MLNPKSPGLAPECGCTPEALPQHLKDNFDMKSHAMAIEEHFPRYE
jgi:hypothetical protein